MQTSKNICKNAKILSKDIPDDLTFQTLTGFILTKNTNLYFVFDTYTFILSFEGNIDKPFPEAKL